MDDAGRLWRRVRTLLRWRSHNAELQEEMALHLALKQEAFEAQGMSPAAAYAAARRAMGDMVTNRESARNVWLTRWVEGVWQDLTYGVRAIRREPTFNAIAILGLAGGLGFSAAAFSAFNTFALRGWNVRESSRLVAIYAAPNGMRVNRRQAGFSRDQLTAFAANAQSLVGVASYERTRPDGTGGLTAAPVSASYFDVLGVPMAKGRAFSPDEDVVGAPRQVLVLSHDYWQRTLRGAPEVIGTTQRVHGVGFTVIGVAAPTFGGTDVSAVDGWIPQAAMPLVEPRDQLSRTALAHSAECCVPMLARLADGATPADVESELTTLLQRTARPGIDTVSRRVMVRPFTVVGSAGPDASNEVTPVFLLIGGGVAVVLLLACANVANLLLARASTRQREISIRLALGASRGRVVRQLMTESLLLALLAGIPALFIARWLPTWILSVLTPDATTLQFTPDARVLLATLCLVLVSAVLFGLTPALHATRPLVMTGTRTSLRSVFLSAQVAFCMVLLVAAGLFVRSLRMARALDLGVTTDQVTELRLTVPATDDERVRGQSLQVDLPAAAARVGVREVAYAEYSPLGVDNAKVRVAGAATDESMPALRVSPEYFPVMRLAVLSGRVYRAASNEVVINALLADRMGGASRAIGASVDVNGEPRVVVGVVRTARDVNLREASAGVYLPFGWQTVPHVLVRGSTADAQRLALELRDRDGSVQVSSRPFTWYVDNALSSTTAAAAMAGALGALALVLAFVGMFGVFSYWVRHRQRDIAIRLALGATRAAVARVVLVSSGRAVAWGLIVGLVAAAGVAMVLRRSLYGLPPLDPLAFGAALATLVLSALIATALPVRRAVRVNPMDLLRTD